MTQSEKRTRVAIEQIDARIAAWCRLNSTTADEFANKLDISSTTLSYKRNGKREWLVSELTKLAEILDTDMNELMGY